MAENGPSAEEVATEDLPGLDLSFDWARELPSQQMSTVDALDAKAIALFGVATAVFGIVVSLGIPSLAALDLAGAVPALAALVTYIAVVVLTVKSVWPRKFDALNNPAILREWYWDMPPKQWKVEMLTYLEDVAAENQCQLLRKGWAVRYLVLVVGLEMLLLALALWL